MSARVTVVIPHYNDAAYLPGAVASIEESEPVAVIVVDDCSSDPAVQPVLDALRSTGVRVETLPENGGAGVAMNHGAALADTRYVFFLGADDLVVPGSLGRLADALDADPGLDFAYGDYEFFGALNHVMESYAWEPWRAYYASCWCGVFMVRRDAHRAVGGFAGRTTIEDWDFFMTCAEQGRRGRRVPGLSFRYRIAESGRRSQAARGRMREERRLLRAAHPALAARRREMQARVSPIVRIAFPLAHELRVRLPPRAGDRLFDVLACVRRSYPRRGGRMRVSR